jgi:hypothetical protein
VLFAQVELTLGAFRCLKKSIWRQLELRLYADSWISGR